MLQHFCLDQVLKIRVIAVKEEIGVVEVELDYLLGFSVILSYFYSCDL